MNKLVLFSGGKDSIITVCKLVTSGNKVFVVTMDPGYISLVESVTDTVYKLQSVFGQDKIVNLGIHDCAALRFKIRGLSCDKTLSELAEDYPNILPYQLQCLECHTAMILSGILICKQFAIKCLVTGSRESQKFVVELSSMINRYLDLCGLVGVQFETPILDLQDDDMRKYILDDYGIRENFIEPRCWQGCPVRKDLTVNEIESLVKYYDNEIKPLCNRVLYNVVSRGAVTQAQAVIY